MMSTKQNVFPPSESVVCELNAQALVRSYGLIYNYNYYNYIYPSTQLIIIISCVDRLII